MDVNQSIPSQALHEWLVFGVRVFVDIALARGRVLDLEPVVVQPPQGTDPDEEDRKPAPTEPPRAPARPAAPPVPAAEPRVPDIDNGVPHQ